ncbi:RNA polymerase-binding protein DksA [Hydrogenophaga crassostreae]|uniref:RNA polymerase-binding protein DksA n=1 Tax=Hydrogenophaga crassostreae TaxID=1763535 RepID=UPI0009EDF393|nr:RNA polymerase-binding protein DksA [Hydrogenophaga crassostreae]
MNATAKKTAKNPKATPVQGKARAAQPASKAAKPVKPAAKATPVAKAAAKPAAKKVAAKAVTKSASKAAPTKPKVSVTKSVNKAPVKESAKTATKAEATPALKKAAAPSKKTASAAATAASKIEPTPKPLGKRAAKKVMMEQMMQAAVVPTHAPDAAKATFSTMNERVLTPPVPSSIQKDPKRANNWKTLPVEQLTDPDVMAMPDSEYMNDVQLAYFRRKLSLLKADMLANAGETTEHLREDTVVVPDPADRATIEEEHALELRTRDRERKLLKKIQQSIVRIDAGDYGYCDETGEAIGVARLMARPTASLSLEAQQRRELKQKMFGD